MDQNWNRWIFASIYKHFDDRRQGVALYLGPYKEDKEWAELRIGGPYISEYTRGCFKLDVNIDIMISCFVDDDVYRQQRVSGIFSSAFTAICIYRYGDGDQDDSSLLGTLQIYNVPINVINYGLVLPSNQFQRSTIDSDFSMYLP